MRSKSKTKDVVGPLKDDNNVLVTDDQSMSHMLNKYFSSVFNREPVNLNLLQVEHIWNGDQHNKLLDIVITEDLVHKKLFSLVANKAPGVDGLVSNIFINTADNISLPLHQIFQRSLNSEEIPADWKRANVCAIYKEGSKDNCENYRPVSLTAQACKILETFIRECSN